MLLENVVDLYCDAEHGVNRSGGREGMKIKSLILDVTIFPCLPGIQMEIESGTQRRALGWSKELDSV